MFFMQQGVDITPAKVSYAVQRGEKMAKERGYQCYLRLRMNPPLQ